MLSTSIRVKSTVAEATTTTEPIRLGVTRRGDNLHVQAFKGTKLIGESSPYPATDEASPAADLANAFSVLVDMGIKVCVGTPKAHWKGEAYVAPRAGQANEFDAGLWYAELFGENEEASIALCEIAEIGFWEADKGVECLRFTADPSRTASGLPLAERIAAAEAIAGARAENRTSSRRMRY